MVEEFQVGVITQTHGIKGEVKVFPTTSEPARFKKLKQVTLDTGKTRMQMEIESVKFFKQFVIVKFKGFDSINDIEMYKNAQLLVDREHAVRLKKDEYYIADLVGLKVISDEDKEIGVLDDVLETGANDVYVIKCADGKEVLFPAIKECILNVDIDAGIVKVHVMDGLMD